jgi:Holliday junction resolvase-like predicted endonuclease
MNAFEEIVKQFLEEKGYWVKASVKVDISKQDKVKIGKYSTPRPEIDLVALNARKNELLLVEVKSLFWSYGVWYEAVIGQEKGKERYRMFWDTNYRDIVTTKLKEEFLDRGLINEKTRIKFALAAGHIHYPEDEQRIREYFSQQKEKWILFSPKDIRDEIKKLSKKGWEDNLLTIATKLIQG